MILTVTPNPCVDKAVWYGSVVAGRMNKGTRSTEIAGGKGNNVSRVLKALGHEVISLNFLGGYTGRRILELLEADGVAPVPVHFDGQSRVITTLRDGAGLDGTELADPDPMPTVQELSFLVEKAVGLGSQAEFVVLSGSVPGPDALGIYSGIMEGLRGSGVPVLLDTNGAALVSSLGSHPHYCKPNVEELQVLMDMKTTEEMVLRDPTRYLSELLGKGVRNPIISLGSRGALALDGARGIAYLATPPVIEAVNPIGSGDSFVAGFLHGLIGSGGDTAEAIRWATASGAANACQWIAGSISFGDASNLLSGVRVERL